MRHPLGWADLSAARVGVFGAGVEGTATLRRLQALTEDIVVVDDRGDVVLDGYEVLATREGGLEHLMGCDVVIKSPGISRYRDEIIALEAKGVAVVGGIGLTLHEIDRTKVVCVTGTKGKSTTSSVIGHLLDGLGVTNQVTGNIGLPPFDLDVDGDAEVLVIETSSFQALDVADAPGIVAVTSLDIDHIDWHGSAERYQADKLSLTSLPGAGITIAQRRSPGLLEHADLLGGDVTWVEEIAGSWAEGLGLVGAHNLANAQIAREVLLALGVEGARDDERLARAAEGFDELPGRLNLVTTIDGVRFVDDSLATNVLPTLAALATFEGEPLALLLGGYDRGIDYSELIDVLATRDAPTLVIGLPDSGEHLVRAIAEKATSTVTSAASSVAEATVKGFAWARPGGVVLLSPAAPSFSQFESWKDRSRAFRDSVASLT